MGGTVADGVVYLTKQEHAEVHLELYKKYGLKEDLWSAQFIDGRGDMSGENNPFYNKKHTYENKLKFFMGKANPMYGMTGEKNGNWGNPNNFRHSKDTREKMSRDRMGENNNFFGKKHSDVFLEGLKKRNKQKYVCEFCGKEMNKMNLVKYGHTTGTGKCQEKNNAVTN